MIDIDERHRAPWHARREGLLGILGVGALVGAGLIYRHEGHSLPVAVIVAVAVVLGVLVLLAARKALAAHRNQPVRTG